MEERADQNQANAISQVESLLPEWREVLMLALTYLNFTGSVEILQIHSHELYDNGNCDVAQGRSCTFSWKSWTRCEAVWKQCMRITGAFNCWGEKEMGGSVGREVTD